MREKGLLLPLFLLLSITLPAQMWNGQDTLYGNEWIDFDQSYYRIEVAEDGIYRIPYATLQSAGLPVGALTDAQYQLWWMGEQQPLYISATGVLGPGDFLEFYGKKNRSELDRYLFENPEEEMLNPYYSLFTDTSAYYLTWIEEGADEVERYEAVENDLTNLPPKEEWFWGEEVRVFTNQYLQETFTGETAESVFTRGEGYASNLSASHNITIPVVGPFTNGGSAIFTVKVFSRPRLDHELRISVEGEPFISEDFFGFRSQSYTFQKPVSALGSSQQISVQGIAASNDRHAISYVSLRYPKRFDFNGQPAWDFELTGTGNAKYLEIENFDGGNSAVLLDLNNRRRILPANSGNIWRVKLPPFTEESRFYLCNESQSIRTVTSMTEITFIDYGAIDAAYIIISNELLFDDGQGNNWVQAYADYRNSPEGGGYETVVVEVQQLYEQFAFGLNRHPLAIRNFGYFVKKQWTAPRYFLLIGKGREHPDIRTAASLASEDNGTFHVPTFGVPGSDNLLLASVSSQVPVIPIGRIAASTPKDIRLYLKKVQNFEASARKPEEAERAWKKEVIHLGGGGNPGEQGIIKNALKQMQNHLEGSGFGANVFSFFKTSSDPIQQSQSEQITNRINDGASIITFFGHSGTGGFDFSIDDPVTYTNKDRYPAIFSLGCLSGQIHLPFKSVGENFLFQEERGAIAFLASTGPGFISALRSFAGSYYTKIGGDHYGQGIGDIMQANIASFDELPGFSTRTLIQQFTLHGDPALVITPAEKPDYLVEAGSVFFEPETINAQLDSINFSFRVLNIGKAVTDSFSVLITREFPDGIRLTAGTLRLPAPSYDVRLDFRLPVTGDRSVGFNRIYVAVDAADELAEGPFPIAEQNNQLSDDFGNPGVQFYIFPNGTDPLFPNDFGIAGKLPLTLKAFSADPFAAEQKYIIELDTTVLFNSPFKKRQEVIQSGGLIEWAPDLPAQDSTVFFWRVSPDSTGQFGYQWNNSSFLYLADSPGGWNQSHFFQVIQNNFVNKEMDAQTRRLKYLDDVKSVRVRNGVYPNTWPEIAVNNDSYLYYPWDGAIKGGLMVCVLDSLTGDPWFNNPPGYYGSDFPTPWAVDYAIFPFSTVDQANRSELISFLRDTIPDGQYVMVYSLQWTDQDYEPAEWATDSLDLGTNLFQVFEAEGIQVLRQTVQTGARPFACFFRKGDPEFPVYQELAGPGESIVNFQTIEGIWFSGTVRTKRIGPAREWEGLYWDLDEIEAQDEFSFDLYGIRDDSVSVLLLEDLVTSDTTLDWVDAGLYPYLQLHYHSTDTLLRSAPQLRYWRITYTGMPDLALAPNVHFDVPRDTVQQGEPYRMSVAVVNASSFPIDSFEVQINLSDDQNSDTFIRRYPPLEGGDTQHIDLELSTSELIGEQSLLIEVNPEPGPRELTRANNIGLWSFQVEEDRKNPLLQVTFDGQAIMDGDIVSARPNIVVNLDDENQYLALDDTSLVRILIKYPTEVDVRAIPMNAEFVTFTPAQSVSSRNRARVELTPHFTESGTYQLIVQAEDASGNESGGTNDYKVAFEVVTESRISNILNYPNPFSTSTRFVYTLTGEEPPPYFTIQIMTVSGRVVRELTQDDLGPLRIGTHQTDFVWDGTDQYGDRLANGVYLYRVMARDINGRPLERYDNGTDQFFENNLGKLVILR